MENISMTQRSLPQAVKAPELTGLDKQANVQQENVQSRPKTAKTDTAGNSREISMQQTRAGQTQQEQTGERTEAQERYNQVMAEKAVENANQRVHSMGTNAKFEYNDEINRITITISDKSSNEVVREIPPEATQKMLERIHTMRGMLMDAEI